MVKSNAQKKTHAFAENQL